MRVVCCLAGIVSVQSFIATPISTNIHRSASGLRMSADVGASFESAFKKISDAQSFRQSDHAEALGFDKWESDGASGEITGYLGQKVDWCSKSQATKDGTTVMSLSCWTFPMYDVPHLSLSVSTGPDGIGLEADLIAKDDLMYAQDYLDNYYGGETLAWFEGIMDSSHTTAEPQSPLLRGRVMSSPVHVDVKMPNEPGSLELLATSVDSLVTRWLEWLEDATEIPRVRRGTMLSRDNILRRMSFAVSCKNPMYGSDAQQISIAISGPGDQAYTGQAS